MGIRVSEEEEREGLDYHEHGAHAYLVTSGLHIARSEAEKPSELADLKVEKSA